MTAEIMIGLAILLAAVALFSWGQIPADVVAIGVMLVILGTGLPPGGGLRRLRWAADVREPRRAARVLEVDERQGCNP